MRPPWFLSPPPNGEHWLTRAKRMMKAEVEAMEHAEGMGTTMRQHGRAGATTAVKPSPVDIAQSAMLPIIKIAEILESVPPERRGWVLQGVQMVMAETE